MAVKPGSVLINGSAMQQLIKGYELLQRGRSTPLNPRAALELARSGEIVTLKTNSNSEDVVQLRNGNVTTSRPAVELQAIASVEVIMVRAASEALRNLANLHFGAPTDVTVDHYDVYVVPFNHGPNAGKIYVAFLHHHPAGLKNTRAGCLDSFGGVGGGFIFDPTTGSTTYQCK